MEITIVSNKHGEHIVYYDEIDAEIISNHTWHIQKKDNNYYSGTNIYVGQSRSDMVLMHRMIMGLPSEIIDHIDGNGLNNRRGNLRKATIKQNVRNSRVASNNNTGYKGVSKDGWTNLWRVWIEVDGKRISGGRFASKNEAAVKYNELAKQYFGDFARLNVIEASKEEKLDYKTPKSRLKKK